jgi:MFS superfamily sulfate permease-like transporter
MAVQPMKAIAAIALTRGLGVPQIVGAGATVGAVLFFLGITGWIEAVQNAVPRSVVRGLQLGLGLTLLGKGVQMVTDTKSVFALDGYLTAAAALVVVLVLAGNRRLPAALVLCLAGLLLGLAKGGGAVHGVRLWHPSLIHLSLNDFETGFLKAGLPQIPLTTLNSVVAVCALASDLFPRQPTRPRTVAVSVGVMNLVGCWFGAMPMCHGAGGLAGQYRFGARTNGSILLLGAAKMGLALLLGSALMGISKVFPASILGVMLAFSGAELALPARDQTRAVDAFVVMVTAGVSLALGDLAWGVGVGFVLAMGFRFGVFPSTEPTR